MDNIFVLLKAFLAKDEVAVALSTLDAGLNVVSLFKILKSKFKKNSIEYQMLCVIDDSLRDACEKFGWVYDVCVVSQESDLCMSLKNKVMTWDGLKELFKVLLGKEIDDSAMGEIVDCFDSRIAKKPELYNYLNLKWKRFNEERGTSVTQPFADFSSYYKYIETEFIKEQADGFSDIVGNESDDSAYIDQFINDGNEPKSALPFLRDWFQKKPSGVLLICGDPGHGKSLLCKKAVVEYRRKNFLNGIAQNVLAVSMNTGKNSSIVSNEKVIFKNMLAWGPIKEHGFVFEDCRGSLLFMDGFDEFIDEARKAGIDNICAFMDRVINIAKYYGMHIVVLSRKIAVSNYLDKLVRICPYYELAPVSKELQDKWLDRHKEYDDYREAFDKLRNDENMAKLLGIPLLFRMIVHNRFETVSSDVVDLYSELFNHLLDKRNIWDCDERQEIEQALMKHAFNVYCTDTHVALPEEGAWDSRWVFVFYVTTTDGKNVGFLHGTFYQYFLAKYIHREILEITDDETAKELIGRFAERELDATVREYLKHLLKEEDREQVHAGIEKMIDALVRTEAYLNFEPHVKSGDAERSRILRSTNIYRNTLHIAAAFSYVIQIPFKGNLDIMMRTFDSDRIVIKSEEDKRADLKWVRLDWAHLNWAYLNEARLEWASLESAHLNEAHLEGGRLAYAHLEWAHLWDAHLEGAHLEGAYLLGTHLEEAHLEGAHLKGAYLTGAVIDIKYKDMIDPSTKGYDTIIWVSEDNNRVMDTNAKPQS